MYIYIYIHIDNLRTKAIHKPFLSVNPGGLIMKIIYIYIFIDIQLYLHMHATFCPPMIVIVDPGYSLNSEETTSNLHG